MLAAQVGKPHGTAGEVYVIRISDDPRRFEPGSRLIHADGRILSVATSRPHRDRFLIRFEGVEDRAAADGLRGALYVDDENLRDLADDEYWTHELVGCAVFLVTGTEIGRVSSILEYPAQDLLVIDTGDGEVLVPAVASFLVDVDVDQRKLVIDPPEGLLE